MIDVIFACFKCATYLSSSMVDTIWGNTCPDCNGPLSRLARRVITNADYKKIAAQEEKEVFAEENDRQKEVAAEFARSLYEDSEDD